MVESRGSAGHERVEEELRRQRDLYESLLRTQNEAGEGFVIAEGWRIGRVNEAFCRISGYSAAELEGLPSFLELIVPEQRAQAGVYVRRRLRNEEVGDRRGVTLVHKSGRLVELEIAVKTLRSDGPTRFVMVARDITATHRAKERGRNTCEFFTQEMDVKALERRTLQNMLRRGLEREEFWLCYQPQVDLATGGIVGVEALLRWHRPELGAVSPATFVPLLEENGLIVPVGEWVLRTACRQARVWQENGAGRLRVAVNLSARQFGREDLVGTVARALEETGLDPRCLELEITESLLVQDIEASSRTLDELKRVAGGVRISIDDFGTGYSSLSYLKSFPIDLLKIDRSFVRNLATDPDDAAITAAIIGLAHNLRLKVIAEGVETEEQLAFLKNKGCDEAQGYYFGRPLPAEDITRLLGEGRPLL